MTVRAAASGIDRFALRERKHARIRVGLWQALRDRIETAAFDSISVRELTAAVEVSEPTFFAHFASKAQLLAYHICLWRIGTTMAASRHPDGAAFLRAFFAGTAESILEGPQMWFEITAEVARGAGVCEVIDVGAAERLLVFGDEAALGVPITPQADLFASHLAVARRDDRPGLDVSQATTALLAAFYGVPLALGRDRLGELADAYRSQLDRILATGQDR